MALAQYVVMRHEGQWKINLGGNHSGPYETRTKAIRAAVQNADAAARIGHDAQVLVKDENNKFRSDWSYRTTRIHLSARPLPG